jgi:hypothetical protein
LNREGATRHLNNWTIVKVLAKERRVDGGRHEDNTQIGVSVDHVTNDHHDEVRVDVSFVNLVDDDVGHAPKARLQLAQEDAHGAKHDRSIWSGENGLKPDTVSSGDSNLK